MARPMEDMCSVMLEIFKQESSPLSPDSSISLLTSFIEDTKELQIFGQERNCASWIGYINGCLNSSKTRLEGLSCLGALVSQCPAEIFQQHCVSWVRLLTQTLQSYDSPPIIALASGALRSILKEASQVSELSRELSNTHIAPIITAALELKTEWQESAVEILTACIQYFPGPSGTFRTRVENFLVQLMGSSNDIDIAVSAGQCLALLPRVGGGGQGGVKHTEAWSYYCQRALASIDGVVDKIYGNSRPGKQTEPSQPPFPLPDAPLKEPTRTYTLIRQYKVLCACLQHMLRTDFPEIVKIPVNRILSLCVSILVPNMLSKGLKSSLQSGNFSSVHIEAFNILAALISSCRGNLSLHRNVVNELFVKSHAFRQGVQSEDTKHRVLSGLKLSAYAALEIWLETVGMNSGIETAAEKLLESILTDAQPQAQRTTLKVTSDKPSLTVKSSGKAKKKGETAGGEASTSLAGQQAAVPSPSGRVCLAALKVLRCLQMSVGTRVKPDFHKDVHEFVVPLLLRLQQSPQGLAPAPYSSADCRKALYHVLLSSVIAPHPRWSAPLQCAVGLFSRGRQDTSIKVSSFCAEASIICQSIIHPRVPCLQQPLSLAQLDPKRAPSQSVSEARTRSDPDYMETTDLSVGLATPSQTAEGNSVGLDSGGGIAPSVDKHIPIRSVGIAQPAVATAKMEVPSNGTEESEDSSDEDIEDQEITEDDPGIKEDNQIKGDYQEIIQDRPEVSASKETTSRSDASVASTSSQLQDDSVLASTVSISGGKKVASSSASSDDSKISSPTRRSKRQLARVQEEERRERENAGAREESGDADSGSKKRRREDEDEDETKEEEKNLEGDVLDETDVMLASFVDSLPDKE
ncbi:proline-, glutamic acid- and leucine-rich protein 1-like isoform X2 [Patiria miniata]|uniref:Proline-, glutamic acid- and leucine-rich protein 1 n=1 Tax=Patiria miniata TaxID=46514 RepID=A0A913ZFE7_PATMI|nr:proline-, glutamic acid- and leucine-rich protein 1-like isoform X2 [Patiria miniata]